MSPPEFPAPVSDAGRRDFRTTHWSMVRAAAATMGDLRGPALEKLCRAYWPPVYTFVRRRGHSPEDAQDLTQGFFARLIEKEWLSAVDATKGRFRTFVLTAVTRFLANEYDRTQALKRGGGQIFIPIDATDAEGRCLWEPSDPGTPESAYDEAWAETLLERVLDRLKTEFAAQGNDARFEILKSFLTDDRGAMPYAEAATQLGLTEAGVRTSVHRLRRRYGELVREEIAQTVSSEEEAEEELNHLLAVLGG